MWVGGDRPFDPKSQYFPKRIPLYTGLVRFSVKSKEDSIVKKKKLEETLNIRSSGDIHDAHLYIKDLSKSCSKEICLT